MSGLEVNKIIAKHLLQSKEPIVKFNFNEPRLTCKT